MGNALNHGIVASDIMSAMTKIGSWGYRVSVEPLEYRLTRVSPRSIFIT